MRVYIQSFGYTIIIDVIVKFLHKYIIYYYSFFLNITIIIIILLLLSDHNVAIINAMTFSMKNHKPYCCTCIYIILNLNKERNKIKEASLAMSSLTKMYNTYYTN